MRGVLGVTVGQRLLGHRIQERGEAGHTGREILSWSSPSTTSLDIAKTNLTHCSLNSPDRLAL